MRFEPFVTMANLKWAIFKSIPSKVESIGYQPIKKHYFFETFRPFAILGKLFGSFSLQNVLQANGHLVRYCFNSKDTLWGPILNTIMLLLAYLYELDPWLRLLFPYDALRIVLVSIGFLYSDRFLPRLIVLIETFDESCWETKNKPKAHWLCHGKTWVCISIVCYIVCLSGVIVEKENFVPRWLGAVMAFECMFPLYVRILYTNMFMFFCWNLTERFKTVRVMWKTEMDAILEDCGAGSDIGRDVTLPAPKRRLERIRLLHCHLVATCQQLNACYGVLVTLYFLSIFVEMLSDVYLYIYLTSLATCSQIIYSFYNALTLFFIVNFAGNLTEASQDIVQDLGSVPVSQLSVACQGQVQIFLSYLSANKVKINAAGFCTVNRGTLVSILIYMTTYIVIIVQFAPDLKKITSFNSTQHV